MSRIAEHDANIIRRAAGRLQAHGDMDLARSLRSIIAERPPLTDMNVADRIHEAMNRSNRWTAGNQASQIMAIRMWDKSRSVREKTLTHFTREDRPQGYTNDELYSIVGARGAASEYTINREVSVLKEHGLIVECGTRQARHGATVMTPHRLAEPARLHLLGRTQGELL